MQEFVIIGGGNMGFAFASLCLEKKLVDAENLVIVERDAVRRSDLIKKLACRVVEDVPQIKRGPLLLAVKPQDMQKACADLASKITPQTLLLSIMAGMQIESISTALGGHQKIVRCMPNTPFQSGVGMTAYFPSSAVSEKDLEVVEAILSAGGRCLRVAKEELLDGVTALSGSGPAYVFYFIEAFFKAAAELGFSEDDAHLMAAQTIKGAVELWEGADVSVEELRKRVTSKGGTTEAAIKVFDSKGVFEALKAGIKQAQIRAQELR